MLASCCLEGKRGRRLRQTSERKRSAGQKETEGKDKEVRQRLEGGRETEGLDWGKGEISTGVGRVK